MFEEFKNLRNFYRSPAFKVMCRVERDQGTNPRILSTKIYFTLGEHLMYNEESGIFYPA